MQILALGGVFDWPVPATGCDMANELLCPLRTNYGSLHSASILSLSPPRSHQQLLNGPQTSNIVPFPTGLQQQPGHREAPAARRSSVQAWKTKARSDFLKMAIPDVRIPGLEQSSARNSPIRQAPAWKKNNNNNNNNFLLSVGKNQESFQGLGVSSCLEMEVRGKSELDFCHNI